MSGYKKLDKAVKAAKDYGVDVNVMYDADEDKYFIIKLLAVKHWENLRETFAEVRVNGVEVNVKMI